MKDHDGAAYNPTDAHQLADLIEHYTANTANTPQAKIGALRQAMIKTGAECITPNQLLSVLAALDHPHQQETP